MGDAARQGADGLHFLSLLQLQLEIEFFLFGLPAGFHFDFQIVVGLDQLLGSILDPFFKLEIDGPYLFLLLP